jgi:hypothetical protein
VNNDSAKRFAMIRIWEFLISSVNTSPFGTNTFGAAGATTVSVLATGAAVG